MKASRQKRKPEFQSQHIEIASTSVENPDWSRDHHGDKTNPRFIEAKINIRESPIGTMHSRRLIDEAQAMAAYRFRQLWETMGGKGAGAMDYTKEPVDGGKIAEPINIRQMQAGIELKSVRVLLGERGYKLVSKVCGEGYQIRELSDVKRTQLSMMDALRDCLDDMGGMWGYSNYAQQKRFAVRK